MPFPAFLFAYTINGYGIALQVRGKGFLDIAHSLTFQAAQNVGYVVRFKDNPGLRMGLLMGGMIRD